MRAGQDHLLLVIVHPVFSMHFNHLKTTKTMKRKTNSASSHLPPHSALRAGANSGYYTYRVTARCAVASDSGSSLCATLSVARKGRQARYFRIMLGR